MTDLPDINVWLAHGVEDHPDHERAIRYWSDEAATQVAFCRVTALGLLRLSTHAAPMRGKPLGVGEAWAAYQAIVTLPEVTFALEPPGCESVLGQWVDRGHVAPRLWTDAYLAAFAVASGMRLVTFDSDFTRFPGLDLLLLS